MKQTIFVVLSVVFIALCVVAQQASPNPSNDVLNRPIAAFDLDTGSLIDGLSKLSMTAQPINIGFEEILRERWREKPPPDPRFSLHLRATTIRQILDTLCNYDSRYTWSSDGRTINVFPRTVMLDRNYLLNRIVVSISFSSITSADDVLTPLAHIFPNEQIGYTHMGGDPSYEKPWSISFTNITVRQLMNRAAENILPGATWIFSGSKDQRFFTFQKGGFRTSDSKE